LGLVRSHFSIVTGDHLGLRPTSKSGGGSSFAAIARSSDRIDMSRQAAKVCFLK
jgi:hypothetical protein